MKKTILTIVLTALVCFCVVGTTFAWLMDVTDPIVNTFTVGDVDITLTETDPTPEDSTDTNSYKMIPGSVISKDPKVTVVGGSERCWLFVKVSEDNNLSTFLEYTVDSGWTKLEGAANILSGETVYYRDVAASESDQAFYVLTSNQVAVKDGVTKEMLNGAKTTPPKLTFTAYAVQYDANDIASAAAAWAIANPTT